MIYGVEPLYNVKDQTLARARALLGPTMNTLIGMDYVSVAEYTAGQGSTPYNNLNDAGGWVQVNTGGVAGSVGEMGPNDGGLVPFGWIAKPKTTRWYARCFGACATATGNLNEMICGLTDVTRSTAPAIALGSLAGSAGGLPNFTMQAWNGGTVYSHSTGVAFDNVNHLWELWGDLTNIHGAIDLVEVGSFAQNLINDTPLQPWIEVYNGTLNAVRTFLADYFYVCLAL